MGLLFMEFSISFRQILRLPDLRQRLLFLFPNPFFIRIRQHIKDRILYISLSRFLGEGDGDLHTVTLPVNHGRFFFLIHYDCSDVFHVRFLPYYIVFFKAISMSLTMARFVEEQTLSDPSLISLNLSEGCRHPPELFHWFVPGQTTCSRNIFRYSYIQRNLSPHNVRRLLSHSGHGWWGVSALRCHRRSVRTDFSEADKRGCPTVARCMKQVMAYPSVWLFRGVRYLSGVYWFFKEPAHRTGLNCYRRGAEKKI